MPRYDVYATRWDDPHIVDELIPTKGLEFGMPRSDHGPVSFEATVEPGFSAWRRSITKDVSGVLIARDGIPVWQGWCRAESQTGPRTFSFSGAEWGSYFTRVQAKPRTWKDVDDHQIFRDLIADAQADATQNPRIQLGASTGAATSSRTVNAWDRSFVEPLLREIAEADGGPEWYFGSAGTLDNPVRSLVLADRLGTTEPATTLEYVEDTPTDAHPGQIPQVRLLGDLFPGPPMLIPTKRAGGNIIAPPMRTRQGDAMTVAVATNDAPEGAQLSATARSKLLGRGWPAMWSVESHSKVTEVRTLQRHAEADLAASEGFVTGYSLVTFDDDPDWTQVPRGSTVLVTLDTDVYAGPRPLEFEARLVSVTVRVPDDGAAQVEWQIETTQEF